MNTAKKTNILNIGKIVSKILEIICWMGVAALLFSAVAGIFNPEWMTQNMIADGGLTMNGVEMQINQNASLASVIIVLLGTDIFKIAGAFGTAGAFSGGG